jgi:hypothetical protein
MVQLARGDPLSVVSGVAKERWDGDVHDTLQPAFARSDKARDIYRIAGVLSRLKTPQAGEIRLIGGERGP